MKKIDELIKLIKGIVRDNNFNQYYTKKYLDYTLVVISLLLGFYLRWDLQNIVLFSFTIWIILNPISSKLLARIVLSFLVFTALLLIIHRVSQAEMFAIFAYYFLVLTTITAIIELRKKQKTSLGRRRRPDSFPLRYQIARKKREV